MNDIVKQVLIATIPAAILGIGAFAFGVFEKGSDAVTEDKIIAIIDKTLVTAAGTTLKARIAEVDGQLIGLETRADALEKEVDDLEGDIFCLAGGCQ